MATAIKPKQKLKLDWSNDKITKISLNSNELVYVELNDQFYNKSNEKPFDMTEINETNPDILKQHMLFIGDLTNECIEQGIVPDKLIEIFRDLFWKMHKRVF